MKIIKRIIVLFITVVMYISNGVISYALENQSEIIGTTKFVDENGDINEVDVYDGTTNEGEEYDPYARTVTTVNMVNFNCSKAGITTNYTDYNTGQDGYMSKSSVADAAFLGYENGKVKFMLSGVTGLVDPNKVEVLNKGTYHASFYIVNSKKRLYHYVVTNVKNEPENFCFVGEAPTYLKQDVEYYSYDGHYFYISYDTMINDYKNNVRTHSVNSNSPYYYYYQYLPLRSKTNYTASQINTYLNNKIGNATSQLKNTGESFIKYQNQFGVNALIGVSFAALESGWGKSSIALNKNNLFGLNAIDSNPGGNANSFDSTDSCIYNFTASWMSQRYLKPGSSVYRGGYLGDKNSGIFVKYSSDPYEGEKIASIAANMDANVSSKDKNYYTIGIKDITTLRNTSLSVRKESNTNSTIYYTTLKNASYAFIIQGETNGFYQVQSDASISSSRNSILNSSSYDYNKSYAYAAKSYITLINDLPKTKISKTTVTIANATYTGNPLKPTVTVKNGSRVLKNGTDYTLAYKNNTNAGTAAVVITGKGNYTGSVTKAFKINAKKITPTVNVTYAKSAYTYNGKTQTPSLKSIIVKYGNKTLKNGIDYTYTKVSGKSIGKYGVKVALKGNYSGSAYSVQGYSIVPTTRTTRLTSGKKLLTVNWNKDSQVTGYQIRYATISDMSNAKTITIKGNSTVRRTISQLVSKKRYYAQVRSYKSTTYNGKATTVYSSWSTNKSVVVN